jgi:hypothetical protein
MKKVRVRRQESAPRAIERIGWLCAATLLGGMFGTLLSVGWGENFRTRVLRVGGLGTFYRIALPGDIRELSDVKTAQIGAPSASDYERIGANNYWIASSEDPNGIIDQGMDDERTKARRVEQNIVIRRHGGQLRSSLNTLLSGRNFIVFEMENSGKGYCSGSFEVKLNGNDIGGVPFGAPSGSEEILSLLRTSQDKVKDGFEQVLCSRRIIEIDLGVKREPFKQILQFLRIQHADEIEW